MLAGLGRLVVRRRLIVVLAWAVLVALGAVLGGGVFDRTSGVDDAPTGSESAVTRERVDALDPEGPVVTAVIRGEDFYSPALVESAGAVLREIAALPGVVEVVDAYTSGGLIGDDARSSLVSIELDPALDAERRLALADSVAARLHTIDAPEVLVGGELLSERAFVDAAIGDSARGEGIAIVVVLILLVVVLGGLRVGVIPILAALASIATALLALAGVIGVIPVNDFAVNIVTLLGLGLAIDYSLLVIVRFRDERARDPEAPLEELMSRTVATAGRAVATSGLAVAIALGGMLLLGDSLLSGMAVGGALVVLVAAAAGLTLVPALVALLARHIPERGVRTWARPWMRADAVASRALGSGLLARLAAFAQRRAVPVAIGAAAVLLLLAAPISGLVVGSSDIRSLPAASEERRAYEAITTGFEDLGVEPVTVLIETGIDDARVPALLDDIAALPEVDDARAVPDLAEEATVVEFTPVGDATGEAAQSLVQQIRALAAASGLPSGVTGAAADVIDTRDHLLERLPLALAAIAVATFALLFALTRSVVVPLKAILLNALTIAATLGVLVAVFQWGWAGALLGIADPGPLDVTTPLLIGLLAFGLSMDYEVFLLARIREEWTRRDRAMPPRAANDRAVLRGVTATGPVVTTAAAAIVIVFLGFAISDVLALKEVGIGMAVAIILDVTIVRGLLLPATMTLLGRANWWRPGRSARPGSPASAR